MVTYSMQSTGLLGAYLKVSIPFTLVAAGTARLLLALFWLR